MGHVQPTAILKHQSPGRLRLQVPSQKGNAHFFQSVVNSLSNLPGIERIEVNPVTGSILLLHSTDLGKIAQFAHEKGLFSTESGKEHVSSFHQSAVKAFNVLEGQVKGFTGGGINLGALASIALIAAGTYQIMRGNFAAIPWYTAFWYGLNLFLKSRPEGGTGNGE